MIWFKGLNKNAIVTESKFSEELKHKWVKYAISQNH